VYITPKPNSLQDLKRKEMVGLKPDNSFFLSLLFPKGGIWQKNSNTNALLVKLYSLNGQANVQNVKHGML
jgi:hypothetical protein